MSDRFSNCSLHLDVNPGHSHQAEAIESDIPFRILIVGDFSGRGNHNIKTPLAGRAPVMVDYDNFDDVMKRMKISVRLPDLELAFASLDDFHPDTIYQKSEVFRQISGAKRRTPETVVSKPSGDLDTTDLLASAISRTEERDFEDADPNDLPTFLQHITKGHLAKRDDPRQLEQAKQLDGTATEQMYSILHSAQFQGLEAAWRSVWMLVQKLDPDADLKIALFDATLDELLSDVEGLSNLLAEQWAVLVGNFAFDQTDGDAAKLLKLGQAASAAQVAFLAEAMPPGETSSDHWAKLRASNQAKWIGLALPRFLVRLPYGKKTEPTESFDFEEMPASVHGEYLWGNPAFLCACLLGLSFREDGWHLHAGSVTEIDGLPLHSYLENGATVIKPCAEVLLSEPETEFLLSNGIMPLQSVKGRDIVRLTRFQSIANPTSGLAGRWVNQLRAARD